MVVVPKPKVAPDAGLCEIVGLEVQLSVAVTPLTKFGVVP